MCVENALRQFRIAGMAGMAGEGERDAQRPLVVLGDALVGGAGLRGAAGDVADQGAMIAQEVQRPVRQLLPVQESERLLGLVLRLINPGARQRARQFADRMAARLQEVVFGFLVAARLEGGQPQECARGAMRGLCLDELARQDLHARPVAFAGFHLECVLDQHFVVGILLQRPGVIACRGRRVVLRARHAAGQIAAEQRAGLDVGRLQSLRLLLRPAAAWPRKPKARIGAIRRSTEERARMSPHVGSV